VELSFYVCLACALFYPQVNNVLGEKASLLMFMYLEKDAHATQPEWKHGLVATLIKFIMRTKT